RAAPVVAAHPRQPREDQRLAHDAQPLSLAGLVDRMARSEAASCQLAHRAAARGSGCARSQSWYSANAMLWYATRQLLLLIPTLAGVAVAVFFLIRVMPGDVVVVKLRADGAAVSEETIQAERKRLGLDKPLYQQFAEYMLGLPRLDLGKSLWTGEPVIK